MASRVCPVTGPQTLGSEWKLWPWKEGREAPLSPFTWIRRSPHLCAGSTVGTPGVLGMSCQRRELARKEREWEQEEGAAVRGVTRGTRPLTPERARSSRAVAS